MKKEGLIANETSVGSPDRVERDVFGGDFRGFWPIQATFVLGELLCDLSYLKNCRILDESSSTVHIPENQNHN